LARIISKPCAFPCARDAPSIRGLAHERHVAIVNQAFVDEYLSGANPLGQRAAIFMKSLEESENAPSEIIGVG